jgi:hypothetical protein
MVSLLFMGAAPVARGQAPASRPDVIAAALGTPVEAAKRFGLTYANPTRETLRALVSARTPAEEKAADIWADSMAAQFRLQELVRSKFGDSGYADFFGRRPRPKPSREEFAKTIDGIFANAKVEIAGDRARVSVRSNGGAGDREDIYLDRRDGQWKVWIGALLQARSATLIDNYVKYNNDYGRVRNRVADDIESGKLTSAAAAKLELGRLEDEEAAKDDPAATQVSSPEKAGEELKAKLQQMRDLEAERDRLEREAATQPIRPSS